MITALDFNQAPLTPPSLLAVLIQSVVIAENNILMARLNKEPSDVLKSPDCSGYGFPEFHHAEELIEVGKAATIRALPEIEKLLS